MTTKYPVDSLNPRGYYQVLDELVNGSVTKTYTYSLQRISEISYERATASAHVELTPLQS